MIWRCRCPIFPYICSFYSINPALSCPTLSYPILSHSILSSILRFPTASPYPSSCNPILLSHPILSCLFLSYPISFRSYLLFSFFLLSILFSFLSYPIPYPILSYPFLSHPSIHPSISHVILFFYPYLTSAVPFYLFFSISLF